MHRGKITVALLGIYVWALWIGPSWLWVLPLAALGLGLIRAHWVGLLIVFPCSLLISIVGSAQSLGTVQALLGALGLCSYLAVVCRETQTQSQTPTQSDSFRQAFSRRSWFLGVYAVALSGLFLVVPFSRQVEQALSSSYQGRVQVAQAALVALLALLAVAIINFTVVPATWRRP